MSYAKGTELTGIYHVNRVNRSQMSHNGLLILSGGDFPAATGVYCDMRVEGFDTLAAGRDYLITFNSTSDIIKIEATVWCENVNAPAHGNGAHSLQPNCRNPHTA